MAQILLQSFIVVFILSSATLFVKGGDSACTSRNGICQKDTNLCSGSYVSGLCAGAKSRRCCVPTSGAACKNFKIISRQKWRAKRAKKTSRIRVPVPKFFIHHTAGSTCIDIKTCSAVCRSVQRQHMNKGWSDIGYSFLVGGDGNVYEGRGWGNIGAHTKGHNSKSFAASFMGNYMNTLPGKSARDAAKKLIACGIQLGKIKPNYRLYGHRDAGATACPGNKLYPEIRTWPHYSKIKP